MPKSGPILLIEDDRDDQEMLQEVFTELRIPNILRFFNTCVEALDYLLTTIEKPFLIISDINLPAMTGMELKKEMNENEHLRNKSIPFVFLSTNPDQYIISKAYEMLVQGYFVKPGSMRELTEMIKMIVDYWKVCRRPVPI
jgi:CheY-like chemotaxis protein